MPVTSYKLLTKSGVVDRDRKKRTGMNQSPDVKTLSIIFFVKNFSVVADFGNIPAAKFFRFRL